MEHRSHRFSQVLDTLGYFGENAFPTVLIASEFVILSVGEVLGYNLSIFTRAETGDLGTVTPYRGKMARISPTMVGMVDFGVRIQPNFE